MRIRLTDVRKAFLAYGYFEGCYAYKLHSDSNVNRSFNSPSSHTNVGCFEGFLGLDKRYLILDFHASIHLSF
jgi:hypothetical protein